jgi:hypothetical protein
VLRLPPASGAGIDASEFGHPGAELPHPDAAIEDSHFVAAVLDRADRERHGSEGEKRSDDWPKDVLHVRARPLPPAATSEMQQKAVPLGTEILSKEAELELAFARARVDDVSLHRILGDIARLQAELRYTHPKYHLAMRELLSTDQIAAYDRARGYKGTSPSAHGHHR